MMAASGYFGDHDFFFASGALEILKTAKLSSCLRASSGHSCLCGGLSYDIFRMTLWFKVSLLDSLSRCTGKPSEMRD